MEVSGGVCHLWPRQSNILTRTNNFVQQVHDITKSMWVNATNYIKALDTVVKLWIVEVLGLGKALHIPA